MPNRTRTPPLRRSLSWPRTRSESNRTEREQLNQWEQQLNLMAWALGHEIRRHLELHQQEMHLVNQMQQWREQQLNQREQQLQRREFFLMHWQQYLGQQITLLHQLLNQIPQLVQEGQMNPNSRLPSAIEGALQALDQNRVRAQNRVQAQAQLDNAPTAADQR